MALTTGIISVAASSAPLVKEGATSLKKLVDVHRPSRNELLGPAATYQASAPCVVADQERVLRYLGVGRASSDWTSASTKESKLRASSQASPKGCPKNWQHVKSDLVKYLSRAEQNLPMRTFSCKSAGALNLDKGNDPLSPTENIVTYPAPGCISVAVHGLSPIDRETGRVQDFRKETPFWDGTSSMLDDGCRSTAQIVDKLKLDPSDDSPIFLNSCNAGTESQGYTPAADMAKQTGRYIIAPVNTRVHGMVRGPRLADKGGEWQVFHPDGTNELLFRPKSR